MYPNAKTCRHLGLCQGNQFVNYPCWLTKLGQIRWGILPSSSRYRPHTTSSQRNVGPNSVSSFGEMALGKFPCRSLLMPSSTLHLILTHKSNKPQHACTGSTRQRKSSRGGTVCIQPQQVLLVSSLLPQLAKLDTGLGIFPEWDSSCITLCPH